MPATAGIITKRRLRFMNAPSSQEQWSYACQLPGVTWPQSRPQHFKRCFYPLLQAAISRQRPQQQRSEDRLPEYLRKFYWWQIVADLPALLTQLNHLRLQGQDPTLEIHHCGPHFAG